MALQDDLIIIKDKVATPSAYTLLIKEFKELKERIEVLEGK